MCFCSDCSQNFRGVFNPAHVLRSRWCCSPFTSITFTKLIAFPKEAVSIVTGDLLPGLDVPQDFDAGRVSARRHKLQTQNPSEPLLTARQPVRSGQQPTLQFGRQSEEEEQKLEGAAAARSSGEEAGLTVVDEGGRAEPQLGAVLPGGVHDAEVVLSVAQQHVLLALRQLGDAAHQELDLIVPLPARQQQRRASSTRPETGRETGRPPGDGPAAQPHSNRTILPYSAATIY